MSILIKGIDMPKDCSSCRFLEGDPMDGLCHAMNLWLDDESLRWYAYEEDDIDDSKPLDCPLVDIPTPHGKLIDRDDIYIGRWDIDTDLAEQIQNAPTILEAEE